MKHIICVSKKPIPADTGAIILTTVLSLIGSVLSLFALAGGIAWGLSKGNPEA